jgi:hypothetical protein
MRGLRIFIGDTCEQPAGAGTGAAAELACHNTGQFGSFAGYGGTLLTSRHEADEDNAADFINVRSY